MVEAQGASAQAPCSPGWAAVGKKEAWQDLREERGRGCWGQREVEERWTEEEKGCQYGGWRREGGRNEAKKVTER